MVNVDTSTATAGATTYFVRYFSGKNNPVKVNNNGSTNFVLFIIGKVYILAGTTNFMLLKTAATAKKKVFFT